ncbi:hypothetical protein G7054_g2740 [Neopestalotiopsis clavispora]|nr:hypothetical protein G7054_g2740 [Neopestalotiopsis clavispora]
MSQSILQKQINLKQISSHSYTISSHRDWSVGPGMGLNFHHLAMEIQHEVRSQNQPDILTLHFQFLRTCGLRDGVIDITDLRLGAGTSDLQLQLSQDGEVKIIALATATNFDKVSGPSAPTAWKLSPPPKPVDFAKIQAQEPDDNWLATTVDGQVLPLTRRILCLNPREGFPTDGVCDAWNSFLGGERMDATYLTLMADLIPSLPDTLLRNGGLYDARAIFAQSAAAEAKNPGAPVLLTNSLAQAARASVFNHTVTLDIEFKRRLPKEGIQWVFTRAEMRMLEGGRGDLDVTICDENLDILLLARQVLLVLDAKRKFRESKSKTKSSL